MPDDTIADDVGPVKCHRLIHHYPQDVDSVACISDDPLAGVGAIACGGFRPATLAGEAVSLRVKGGSATRAEVELADLAATHFPNRFRERIGHDGRAEGVHILSVRGGLDHDVGAIVESVGGERAAGVHRKFHVRISKGRNCPTIP